MINFQRLAISMVLIVLSIVHINASSRQAINPNCPAVNLCDYGPCSNGQCVDDKTTSSCFRCECPADFTGASCETQITTPSSCNPACLNGGSCEKNAANVFACVCSTNYTGSQCETSVLAIHPCVTMPGTLCLNGGTCTIAGSGHLCSCPAGFSGVKCETQTTTPTTCDPNTCDAHGTCRVYITQNSEPIAVCICESQWTGVRCETPLSTTTTDMTTTDMTTTDTTTATTGTSITTGTSTLTPTSGGCSPNPCLNGGSCFATGNSFICVCRQEFSGLTCNVQNPVTTPAQTTTAGVNPCSTNPCLNGGSCYRYLNSFICVCTASYAGLTCNAPKTTTVSSITTPSSTITCANQPCQNGATCYNAGTSYFCYCGSNNNFAGKNCDTPKVISDSRCSLECSPGYCVRAGHGSNTHACMCNGTLTPGSCRSQ